MSSKILHRIRPAPVPEPRPIRLCSGQAARERWFLSQATRPYPQTAPSEADDTNFAYLASAPLVNRGAGAFHFFKRLWISFFVRRTDSSRFAASTVIQSPSFSAAIGPPTAASGATCPAISPWVAPENRPSVSRATLSPSPSPYSAPVTASISRIPGPPLGPS